MKQSVPLSLQLISLAQACCVLSSSSMGQSWKARRLQSRKTMWNGVIGWVCLLRSSTFLDWKSTGKVWHVHEPFSILLATLYQTPLAHAVCDHQKPPEGGKA